MSDRVGVTLPLPGIRLAEHAEHVRKIESLGYTDLWSAETSGPDAFTPLTLAAAWTENARLVTGIAGVFQRGRAVLAQQSAALSDASSGRFALGIGASSDRLVEGWNGVPFERPLSKIRDTLDFLEEAFAGERGPGGIKLEAPPREPIPIILAALRGKMLALAAERTSGAFTNFLPLSGVSRVASELEDAGAGEEFELACRFFCIPGRDAEAERKARFFFAAYGTVPVYRSFLEWLGYSEKITPMCEAWAAGDRARAAELAPWDLIEETFLLGTPEEMRDRLGAFAESGIDTPVLMPMTTPEGVPALLENLAPR